MLVKVRTPIVVLSGFLAAACVDNVTGPPSAVCLANYSALVLTVGQYVSIDPVPTQGCVIFPANASTTDSAEYLLVPQTVSEVPDFSASYKIMGTAPLMAQVVAPRFAASVAPPESPAARFHELLRQMEQSRTYPPPPPRAPRGTGPLANSTPYPCPVTLGGHCQFMVLRSLTGAGYTNVDATIQSVGQHVAIYVDDAAPSGSNGLSTAGLDSLRDAFDQKLYPADTAAFGRESDIDGNGLVFVLMTSVVNKLVTAAQCTSSGYVAGFFFGADIDPLTSAVVNNGEVFYTMVADPTGSLSCSHSVAQVKRVVPGTLVHEFQHMISYNHHVLMQPPALRKAEVLWLNEGLSHFAEELGGRAFLPDTITFCNYVSGDLNNADGYLSAPGDYPLVDTSGIGGLEERGAAWLFVRYMVDRFTADTSVAVQNGLTRALVHTSLTGTNNVAQQTGAPYAQTAGAWALANWVSDLPGFAAPAALRYKKWAFRTAYPKLNAACGGIIPPTFPLVATASPGQAVNVAGRMIAGSGATYQRALQGQSGASFNVLFSDSTGAQLKASVAPRLNVVRIR